MGPCTPSPSMPGGGIRRRRTAPAVRWLRRPCRRRGSQTHVGTSNAGYAVRIPRDTEGSDHIQGGKGGAPGAHDRGPAAGLVLAHGLGRAVRAGGERGLLEPNRPRHRAPRPRRSPRGIRPRQDRPGDRTRATTVGASHHLLMVPNRGPVAAAPAYGVSPRSASLRATPQTCRHDPSVARSGMLDGRCRSPAAAWPSHSSQRSTKPPSSP